MTEDEIRLLFDEAIAHFKKRGDERFRDRQFFFAVLGDTQETRDAFLRFLHDVATCPPEVIAWCQSQINAHRRPGAVH